MTNFRKFIVQIYLLGPTIYIYFFIQHPVSADRDVNETRASSRLPRSWKLAPDNLTVSHEFWYHKNFETVESKLLNGILFRQKTRTIDKKKYILNRNENEIEKKFTLAFINDIYV